MFNSARANCDANVHKHRRPHTRNGFVVGIDVEVAPDVRLIETIRLPANRHPDVRPRVLALRSPVSCSVTGRSGR